MTRGTESVNLLPYPLSPFSLELYNIDSLSKEQICYSRAMPPTQISHTWTARACQLLAAFIATAILFYSLFHQPTSSPSATLETLEAARQIAPTQVDSHCPPLPPPSGTTVTVSSEGELWNAVNNASPGTTVLIANGTYNLASNGYYLWIDTPGLTLRSASGDREAVVLDDNYQGSETITVAAFGVCCILLLAAD